MHFLLIVIKYVSSTETNSVATSVFMSLADVTKTSSTLVALTYAEIQKISLSLHQSMLHSIDADLALSIAVNTNVSVIGKSVSIEIITIIDESLSF